MVIASPIAYCKDPVRFRPAALLTGTCLLVMTPWSCSPHSTGGKQRCFPSNDCINDHCTLERELHNCHSSSVPGPSVGQCTATPRETATHKHTHLNGNQQPCVCKFNQWRIKTELQKQCTEHGQNFLVIILFIRHTVLRIPHHLEMS